MVWELRKKYIDVIRQMNETEIMTSFNELNDESNRLEEQIKDCFKKGLVEYNEKQSWERLLQQDEKNYDNDFEGYVNEIATIKNILDNWNYWHNELPMFDWFLEELFEEIFCFYFCYYPDHYENADDFIKEKYDEFVDKYRMYY